MKIGGIGKYPFLSASSERVECGRVLTGQSVTKHFKLRNSSLVYAHFKIVSAQSLPELPQQALSMHCRTPHREGRRTLTRCDAHAGARRPRRQLVACSL